MKRFYKNSLIIALVCICVGVCMTLAGIIGGGFGLLEKVVKGSEFLEEMSSKISEQDAYFVKDLDDKESAGYTYSMEEYQIENLDFDIGASDLNIAYEDTDVYSVAIEDGDKHSCRVKDGTLMFETSGDVKLFFGKDNRAKITLTIPKNAKLNRIDIDLGAGKMTTEYLTAEDVSIDVGAGDVQVDSLLVENDAQLTVGAGNMEVESLNAVKNVELTVEAGNMELNSMQAQKADITCEAGRFYGDEVKLSSNVQVECGAGSVYLDMEHNEKDFNYDLECSVGSVSVGDEKYSGIDMEKRVENQADKEFGIECSVGSVEIEFEG